MDIYSHGKILLTAEYAVLNGVTALALPTKRGQHFTLEHTQDQKIVWQSFDVQGKKWIDVVFDLDFHVVTQTDTEEKIIETLQNILSEMAILQPNFYGNGFSFVSRLEFERSWGLGSSSTLFHALRKGFSINPYQLLEATMGGSGYDIAAAEAEGAILYQRNGHQPKIQNVSFMPAFAENLFFIHLNQKQDSGKAVAAYNKRKAPDSATQKTLEVLGQEILLVEEQDEFNALVKTHEIVIGKIIGQTPIQERLFPDFNGQIKSLGAWGGDFILASGGENTVDYFKDKGYTTVIPYREFILK